MARTAAARVEEPRVTRSVVEMIRSELTRIRARRGKLTPQVIVEEASSASHPLHRFFTWDDAEAAQKQRLSEAIQLVQRVHLTVQVSGEERQMREFVNVTRNDAAEYVPVSEVSLDPRLREQVVERARMEIDGWTKRYETYESYFQSAFAAIKDARKKFPRRPRGAK